MAEASSDIDSAIAGLAVSLRGVTKAYDNGVMALGPLDLHVRNGEFVSLLGPSGCGKSTALRLIAGLTAPTRGAIEWRDVEQPAARALGFVFQEPTLMPWADVFGNVHLPLKLKGLDRAAAAPTVMDALGG